MRLRPIDQARERPAPAGYVAVDATGSRLERTFHALSVVVAVKPGCDGCRDFVESDPEIPGFELHVIAEAADPEWSRARRVVVAAQLWRELEIISAPYFVLVDPVAGSVIGEGSVFSASQVAEEVARQSQG